ncbi:MAG: LEA type 2 family protein [Bacteroidia bacterium]|nr:LEA type 2 family protein [Bacteroidia bacterium]
MKNFTAKITSRVIKKFVLLLLIGILCLVIFYLFNPKKAITLVFPELNRISYVNAIIKNDSAFTKLSLVLENKNPYKLDIDSLYFEIKLNATSIAKQMVALNIKQSRFEKDTVKVPLNLSIKQVKNIIANLQDQDSTTLEASGFIVYQTIFGRTKIDFKKITPIQVPVPPKIKVLKVERKNFNYRERILKVNATIEIINAGKNLDLVLRNIHYNLTVKNTLHSSGTLSEPITIKPRSSIIITIPMEVEAYHPLKTVWLIKIDKDKLNYALHITGNVKENISEKAFTSPIEIEAKGVLELVK